MLLLIFDKTHRLEKPILKIYGTLFNRVVMIQFLKNGSMHKYGLGVVDEFPWGTHFCQLCETKIDLINILDPYFT